MWEGFSLDRRPTHDLDSDLSSDDTDSFESCAEDSDELAALQNRKLTPRAIVMGNTTAAPEASRPDTEAELQQSSLSANAHPAVRRDLPVTGSERRDEKWPHAEDHLRSTLEQLNPLTSHTQVCDDDTSHTQVCDDDTSHTQVYDDDTSHTQVYDDDTSHTQVYDDDSSVDPPVETKGRGAGDGAEEPSSAYPVPRHYDDFLVQTDFPLQQPSRETDVQGLDLLKETFHGNQTPGLREPVEITYDTFAGVSEPGMASQLSVSSEDLGTGVSAVPGYDDQDIVDYDYGSEEMPGCDELDVGHYGNEAGLHVQSVDELDVRHDGNQAGLRVQSVDELDVGHYGNQAGLRVQSVDELDIGHYGNQAGLRVRSVDEQDIGHYGNQAGLHVQSVDEQDIGHYDNQAGLGVRSVEELDVRHYGTQEYFARQLQEAANFVDEAMFGAYSLASSSLFSAAEMPFAEIPEVPVTEVAETSVTEAGSSEQKAAAVKESTEQEKQELKTIHKANVKLAKTKDKIADTLKGVASEEKKLDCTVEWMDTQKKKMEEVMANHVMRLHDNIDHHHQKAREAFNREQENYWTQILEAKIEVQNRRSRLAAMKAEIEEKFQEIKRSGVSAASTVPNLCASLTARLTRAQEGQVTVTRPTYSFVVPEILDSDIASLVGTLKITDGDKAQPQPHQEKDKGKSKPSASTPTSKTQAETEKKPAQASEKKKVPETAPTQPKPSPQRDVGNTKAKPPTPKGQKQKESDRKTTPSKEKQPTPATKKEGGATEKATAKKVSGVSTGPKEQVKASPSSNKSQSSAGSQPSAGVNSKNNPFEPYTVKITGAGSAKLPAKFKDILPGSLLGSAGQQGTASVSETKAKGDSAKLKTTNAPETSIPVSTAKQKTSPVPPQALQKTNESSNKQKVLDSTSSQAGPVGQLGTTLNRATGTASSGFQPSQNVTDLSGASSVKKSSSPASELFAFLSRKPTEPGASVSNAANYSTESDECPAEASVPNTQRLKKPAKRLQRDKQRMDAYVRAREEASDHSEGRSESPLSEETEISDSDSENKGEYAVQAATFESAAARKGSAPSSLASKQKDSVVMASAPSLVSKKQATPDASAKSAASGASAVKQANTYSSGARKPDTYASVASASLSAKQKNSALTASAPSLAAKGKDSVLSQSTNSLASSQCSATGSRRKRKRKKKAKSSENSSARPPSPDPYCLTVHYGSRPVKFEGRKKRPSDLAPRPDGKVWLVYGDRDPNLDLLDDMGKISNVKKVGGNAFYLSCFDVNRVLVAMLSISPGPGLRMFDNQGDVSETIELEFTPTSVCVGNTGIAVGGKTSLYWICLDGGENRYIVPPEEFPFKKVGSTAVAPFQDTEIVYAVDKGTNAVYCFQKEEKEFSPLPLVTKETVSDATGRKTFLPVSITAHPKGFLAILDAADDDYKIIIFSVARQTVVNVLEANQICTGTPTVLAFGPDRTEDCPTLWTVADSGCIYRTDLLLQYLA